jgi:hypothetical protein
LFTNAVVENKGCWLRTLTKNNKKSYSDIWIPSIDILMKEKKITQSFIKNSLITKKEVTEYF